MCTFTFNKAVLGKAGVSRLVDVLKATTDGKQS